jgi:hypothetical protein
MHASCGLSGAFAIGRSCRLVLQRRVRKGCVNYKCLILRDNWCLPGSCFRSNREQD